MMYQATAARTALLKGYQSLSLEARVMASSPHALVQMLYDRLHVEAVKAATAAENADVVGRMRGTEKALAIVGHLEETLDDRGGRVTDALRQAYGLVRDGLLSGDENGLTVAIECIEAMRDSWRSITPSA